MYRGYPEPYGPGKVPNSFSQTEPTDLYHSCVGNFFQVLGHRLKLAVKLGDFCFRK